MFCQACGADNSADARFCNMCGSAIAKPGTPGGIVADGTVKGTGEAPPVRAEAPVAESPAPHVPGTSATVPAQNVEQGVWDQGGGSVGARSYGGGGGMSGIGNATLAGVGVKSSKRAWTVILVIAVLLVGFGALAGWALGGDDPPLPEDYDPEVAENQAEIGLPLPEGVDLPEEAVFDGAGGGTPATMMGGGMAGPLAGNGEEEANVEPPPTTTIVTGGGGTSMTGTGTSMTGTSMTGTSMTGTSMTGTTMTGTSMTGTSMTGTSMTGTSMANDTIPGDVPEERDIAMSMYSQRVRFVIARYYASRAQTCFDLATRNSPDLRGEVRISLTISADGNVTEASPVRNTTGNQTLGQCLAGRVRQWRLPPPPGGELTMVLPFRN